MSNILRVVFFYDRHKLHEKIYPICHSQLTWCYDIFLTMSLYTIASQFFMYWDLISARYRTLAKAF